MEVEEFTGLIKNVTAVIADNNLNEELADLLNLKFPENGSTFNDIQKSCLSGIEAGWMCNNVAGSIRFGRVIKDVDGFSVDVVLMDEVVGPQRRAVGCGDQKQRGVGEGGPQADGHGNNSAPWSEHHREVGVTMRVAG